LKAFGITCGVLVLLMVIGGVMVANFFNQQKKNPNSIYGQTMKLAGAGIDGVAIQKAIVQYHSDNGAYPANLAALVPKYVDAAKLHNDMDTNPNPSHVSWTYHMPGPDATGKTSLLELPYTLTMTFGGKTTSVPGKFIINLDGTSTSGNTQGGYDQTPKSTFGQ
jgi:hypothetical protein